ncbi:MAG TPA: hypothetical protein VNB49_11595 [Candidatus Dormibacteraeota bacterium]|nr:hypothetical protein [Candidatus Dormibacteraeota bacterium]
MIQHVERHDFQGSSSSRQRTEKAVETAFAAGDKATLEKYGRFLEPILQTMMSKDSNRSQAQKLANYLSAVQSALITQSLHKN